MTEAVINVLRDGVRSNMKGRAMGNFPLIPQDEPMDGPFYPVLFDPERELGDIRDRIPVGTGE